MAGIALFDDRAAHRFPQTVVAAAGLLFAAGALAHHSAAAFDVTKEVSIEGTVADLEDVRGDGAQLEVHRGGAGRTS